MNNNNSFDLCAADCKDTKFTTLVNACYSYVNVNFGGINFKAIYWQHISDCNREILTC